MKKESKVMSRIAGANRGSNTTKGLIIVIVFVTVSVFLFSCQKAAVGLEFKTNYQALLLSNNNAYFGHIEEMGPQFVTLTDVFYIQSKPTEDPKLVNNVLVKRGKEIHKPDKMYISREHIIAIEPVANDSQLVELIRQEKEKAGK